MAIKIKFDSANKIQTPTFVLATRTGRKLGTVPAYNISFSDSLNACSELFFKVNKVDNGIEYAHWDKLKDFRLVWCKDWDIWFEIYVEIDNNKGLVKNVTAKSLGEAELSQINLYDIEINTEDDIAREDYKIPTVLYNSEHPEASLLHRIMEKAPHYHIDHVDSGIANIQRTFSFNNTSLYDALQDISEEIKCLFIINSGSDSKGHIDRKISVYDLESYCYDCGNREEFTIACPKCGSKNISSGYGKDTTIFISEQNLADNITYSTDTNSVKNCFKLEAGDDLMTATVRNCNPNGTDYIWHISDDTKEDMSKELVDKLNSYDDLYKYYQNDYVMNLNVSAYNSLVQKYQSYNKDLKTITSPIKGYPALMTAYYNTIDLSTYLQSELMPNATLSDTNAVAQARLLTSANLSPVAVSSVNSLSSPATADSAVLGMAKVIVDSRYQVKVNTSSLSNQVWTGSFTVTNYSDEEDTATSSIISIAINDNYENFVRQKIKKTLNKEIYDGSILGLFEKDISSFKEELKKYCLNRLTSFYDACEACIGILIDQGIADKDTWSARNPNLYDNLYLPYLEKSKAIADEKAIRQGEINVILGVHNVDGELISNGVQTYIEKYKNDIQNKLNFEKYLGNQLWLEFCSFRREDEYSNSNYISDGLNNAELFNRALEFIQVATKEIYKSAELQHSISTTLKNLLVIKKFSPIVDYFEVGNWIRIKVDDTVYRLRLIEYEVEFENLQNISVEFSDATKVKSSVSEIRGILTQAQTMATSYDSVKRQASQGAESNNVVNDWFTNGLDTTNTKIIGGADNQTQTWDSHGMLFRQYEDITDSYSDTQLKIINSTLAITKDNWETVSTAVGGIYYQDPKTGELKYNYGINANVLVGNLILGNELGIYNKDSSLTFDDEGLFISKYDDKSQTYINSVRISPEYGTCNFYYGGRDKTDMVGRIGTSCWSNDNTKKGMLITLDESSDYITMGSYTENDTVYSGKFAYLNCNNLTADDGHGGTVALNQGLWAFDKLYLGDSINTNGCPIYIDRNDKTCTMQYADGYSGLYSQIGIRFETNSGNIDMQGNVDMNGHNILNQSDVRLKTNIKDTNVNALDKINQIELKEFDWIENNEHENIGIIAQQLETILPDLIYRDENTDKLSIKTDRFIPYLIKAVQELYNLISKAGNMSLKTNKVINKTCWTDNYSESEKQQFTKKTLKLTSPKQHTHLTLKIPK